MMQRELFPAIPAEVQARVDQALEDPATSPCARAVLILIRDAAGRENAVSIHELRAIWIMRSLKVYSERDIKAAVKELLEERGVPVGSARSGSPGYFLLCSPEDIDQAERPLVGEIRSLARRLRCINPKSSISRLLSGQVGME